MIINFSDGCTYDLDTNKSYEERLKLVNEILSKYHDDFNIYWESKEKNQQHSTKTTLDILGAYLYYASTKELNKKHDILTERQMRRRTEEIELPVGLFDEESESNLEGFSEQHKRINPKKNDKKYFDSKMHRLNTIYIPISERKNRIIKDKPLVYKFFSNEETKKKKEFKVETSDYLEYKNINCFTKSDLKLPYIDKNKPYLSKWCYVDNDNKFKFCCLNFKIKIKYNFDMILCLWQQINDKELFYFLDNNINVINNNSIKLIN